MAAPATRARMSLGPPAANPTTIRIGLVGYALWACTAPIIATLAAAAANAKQMRRCLEV